MFLHGRGVRDGVMGGAGADYQRLALDADIAQTELAQKKQEIGPDRRFARVEPGHEVGPARKHGDPAFGLCQQRTGRADVCGALEPLF